MAAASKGGDALAQMLSAGQSADDAIETAVERPEVDSAAAQESFERSKAIVMEKGQHKDWQQRELALTAMHDCFEAAP